MNNAVFNAKTLRIVDSTAAIPEVMISPGVVTFYNGTQRLTITPTNMSSDGIFTISNVNLSGSSTGATVITSDNSSTIATTAFVKAQTFNLTGYAQPSVTQTWTAQQNFSTLTASTPASNDNSSTVATTAFVNAQTTTVSLPIVLGTTGVVTKVGQTVSYSTTPGYSKTFNSTARCFTPSGLLAVGTYIIDILVYANPATYNVMVYGIAASATQMTEGQTTGLDYATYNILEEYSIGTTITNGVAAGTFTTPLTIVSTRPYISVYIYLTGGTTTVGNILFNVTRLA